MATLPLVLGRAKLTNRERIFSEASYWISPATTFSLVDRKTGTIPSVFTRASTATYFDRNGILQTAAVNEPVIEWDPATGACLGWRIWDGVTNLVLGSNQIGGAQWINQGSIGVTLNTTDVKDPAGGNSATKLVYGASNSQSIQALSLGSNTFTESVFLRTSTGTADVVVRLFLAASPFTLIATNTFTVTTSWTRVSVPATVTSASSYNFSIYLPNSGTTVYAYGAQLNTGPLAPYVPTGALTASSTADVASITGAAFAGIINTLQGAVFAETVTQSSTVTDFSRIVSIDQGNGTPNFMALVRSSGISRHELSVFAGTGQAVGLQPAVTLTANSNARSAFSYATDDFICAVSGVLSAADTLGSVPTGLATLGIGSQGNGSLQLKGYIRELAIWKSRRPNANLQYMTQ